MPSELVVSGIGVVSALGQGKEAFIQALLAGRQRFGVMRRPGRQHDSAFVGAEIDALTLPSNVDAHLQRTISLSTKAALAALFEAWEEAGLDEVDAHRIGLVVGGSNLQQRELVLTHDFFRTRVPFLRPTYAVTFMDTDIGAVCTQCFGIRGPAYTVGGASASGQVALMQAVQAVRSDEVDVCVAVGALTDLSYWECQALRSVGAMGSDRFGSEPELACRPFDRERDGFIFGEMCGVLVVESARSCERRGRTPYAFLRGWNMTMDGNRNPDPSPVGEMHAIRSALHAAGWKAAAIDYVNPHGTGSPLGDETELRALKECSLNGARINTTKSLVGHGLAAAGAVEAIAMLLQMKAGELHPSRNLSHPIDESFAWVGERAERHAIRRAMTLSMGFGGINTALCWENAMTAY